MSRGFLAGTGGTVSGERPGYLAYLLRMWRVEVDGEPRWRASLERPSDGERYVFGSLDATFDFLHQRSRERRQGSPAPADEIGRGAR